MAGNWKDLPDQFLLEVFRCLSINDRRNASLTCWKWSRILNSPSLWHSVFCMFEPEYTIHHLYNEPCFFKRTKCLPVIRRWAPSIRELTVVYYDCTKENEDVKDVLDIMETFVRSLMQELDDVQLRKFTLDMSYHPFEEEIIQRLLMSLVQFLRNQNSLISFSGIWALPGTHCTFMSTVTFYSATTLKVLEIVHKGPKRFDEPYCATLSKLTLLQYLTLPYEALGEYTIRVLAENCLFLILLTLSIDIREVIMLETDNLVSEDTWKEVSELQPQLGVAIEIENLPSNLRDLDIILPTTIPIIGVRALWYPLNPQIILHLHQFKHQIMSLELVCGEYKYVVINLINSCPHLAALKLITTLSGDTVDTLTNLDITEFKGLKRFTLLLELEEELKQREQDIIENYRNLWKSSQYYMEIFSNPQTEIYRYLRRMNFCTQIYPAI